MVVAGLQGVVDGIFLAVGILPSAKAEGWDGGTSVELVLGRHLVCFDESDFCSVVQYTMLWWMVLVWVEIRF